MFRFLLILAVWISEIRGQLTVSEKCPDVAVLQNFDVNKYMGKWYEYSGYPNTYEPEESCTKEVYTLLTDGTVKIHSSLIKQSSGKLHSAKGSAKFSGKNTEAKLSVNYEEQGASVEGHYWVLETDYDSYSVVWACNEKEVDQKTDSTRFVWLLTRTRSPSADIVTKMNNALDKLKISRDKLKVVKQENCTEKK